MAKRIIITQKNGYYIAREGKKFIIVAKPDGSILAWAATQSEILLILSEKFYN